MKPDRSWLNFVCCIRSVASGKRSSPTCLEEQTVTIAAPLMSRSCRKNSGDHRRVDFGVKVSGRISEQLEQETVKTSTLKSIP